MSCYYYHFIFFTLSVLASHLLPILRFSYPFVALALVLGLTSFTRGRGHRPLGNLRRIIGTQRKRGAFKVTNWVETADNLVQDVWTCCSFTLKLGCSLRQAFVFSHFFCHNLWYRNKMG